GRGTAGETRCESAGDRFDLQSRTAPGKRGGTGSRSGQGCETRSEDLSGGEREPAEDDRYAQADRPFKTAGDLDHGSGGAEGGGIALRTRSLHRLCARSIVPR